MTGLVGAFVWHRGWAVHAIPNPATMRMTVSIGRGRLDQIEYVTGLSADGFTYAEPVAEGGLVPAAAGLVLNDDLARALHEVLCDIYGGPGADRELRSHYLEERGRVDQLQAALITIATGTVR